MRRLLRARVRPTHAVERKVRPRAVGLVVFAMLAVLVTGGCVFFAVVDQRTGVPVNLDFTDISGTGRYVPVASESAYVTQVKNPDRYEGSAYITSQTLSITETAPDKAMATAQWPGRYVFERHYRDNSTGEVKTENRFVTVRPVQQLFEIRGAYVWTAGNGPTDMEALSRTLDDLRGDGFNWVKYEVYFTFDGAKPTRVFLCDAEGQQLSPGCFSHPTPDELRDATALARSKGFHVAWHINGNSFDPSGPMGRYELWNIEPPNLQAFFSSYADMIVGYAALAEATGVELLSLSEFSEPLRDVGRVPYQNLIGRVRSAYGGKVTAAEFMSPGMVAEVYGPQWETEYPVTDLLDYVGAYWSFNAGVGGAPGPSGWTEGDCNPPVETMEVNLFADTGKYLMPYAMRHKKPVVVMNLPFLDHDCFNWHMTGDASDYSRGRDEQEGVDVTEASLRVMVRQGIKGFFIGPYWPFEAEPDPRHGPMQEALRIWLNPQ